MLFFLAAAASGKVYIPPLPTMPAEYALKVSYRITTAGKTAHYLTARAYNLNTTSKHVFQYREDDLVDGTLVATTVELPTTHRAAYRYNHAEKECTDWAFTSAIDGFPLLYRTAPYVMGFLRNETVRGVEANVFQYVFEHWWDQLAQKYVERTYTVWFKRDTNEPLQVFDSTADIDGHLYTVTDFTLKVDDAAAFVVPADWKCKEPAAAELALFAAPEKVYIPPLPTMPSEYALKVSYSITTAGKTAQYLTARAYNLNTTSKHVFQYREDDLVDGTLVATTVELPTTHRAAYRYNHAEKECTDWAFTSAIDGFPLLYRTAPYVMGFLKNETVRGV